MKKSAILIAALFILVNANAQKVHFGIKGGVNACNLHYSYSNSNTTTNTDSKIGLNLGVLAHLHASKTWAIQPEILYSLEGASYKTAQGTNHINLNYINVPVLLQYMFKNGFRLEGGPQIGFLVSAKTKTPNVAVTNNNFDATAVSIPLGIGYLTSSGLGLDVRYAFGLSNIDEDKNGPVVQSNVFQMGLFYQFTDTKVHRQRSRR